MIIQLDDFKVFSESNSRDHWRARHARARAQKEIVSVMIAMHKDEIPNLPVRVTLTRISSGKLDDDNLRGAFKAVRDQLATTILPEATQANQSGRRGDDSDPRIEWRYEQRKCSRGNYGVEIKIEGVTDGD